MPLVLEVQTIISQYGKMQSAGVLICLRQCALKFTHVHLQFQEIFLGYTSGLFDLT